MSTFHLQNLPKQKRIQMIGEFYDMIDSLKNRSEVRMFFRDLLSADEIASLMRRIEIAVLLMAGFKYHQIINLIGVGRDKIANVQKHLLQDENGYRIIAKRLIENRKERIRRAKHSEQKSADMSLLVTAKKTYKAPFMLNHVLDAAIMKLQEDKKSLEQEAILFTPSASRGRKSSSAP